jgi:ATPase subunit of ABC transporter with duplicated ATPase domains
MAGVDTDIDGDAIPMPNITIGYLEQEPKLDPDKTVREVVEEGLAALFEARRRLDAVPWKGNYSSWLDQKQARLAQEEASESARQKALKRELEWVRAGTKGQQTKSKSRIARFEELSTYEYQMRNETSEIFIPVADRLGAQVIEFEGVRKAYGDRLLMDDSTSASRRARSSGSSGRTAPASRRSSG